MSSQDFLTERLETFSSDVNVNPIEFASQRALGLRDFIDGLKKWRIWVMLGYQDIKLRYRRSVLGPLWITVSMAITVYSMGFLYAHLFHIETSRYFPFLVSGMLSWSLIASIITDVTEGLIASEGLIKQIKLPYTVYMHRLAFRNLLIFLHNFIVMIPIYLIFYETIKINFSFLLIIPGILLVYINSITFGLIISMLGARYRDISQVIKSLLQVIFFVTPIMWTPEVLGIKNQWVVLLNPIYPFIQLIRSPILGQTPPLFTFISAVIISSIGIIVCMYLFFKYRARIVYWL